VKPPQVRQTAPGVFQISTAMRQGGADGFFLPLFFGASRHGVFLRFRMDKDPGKPVQYLAKEASLLTGQPEVASSIARCEMANCRVPVSACTIFHQWSRKARASRTIRDL